MSIKHCSYSYVESKQVFPVSERSVMYQLKVDDPLQMTDLCLSLSALWEERTPRAKIIK